jgi:hypothetical protein
LLSLSLASLAEATVENRMNQKKLTLAINTILRCSGITENEIV